MLRCSQTKLEFFCISFFQVFRDTGEGAEGEEWVLPLLTLLTVNSNPARSLVHCPCYIFSPLHLLSITACFIIVQYHFPILLQVKDCQYISFSWLTSSPHDHRQGSQWCYKAIRSSSSTAHHAHAALSSTPSDNKFRVTHEAKETLINYTVSLKRKMDLWGVELPRVFQLTALRGVYPIFTQPHTPLLPPNSKPYILSPIVILLPCLLRAPRPLTLASPLSLSLPPTSFHVSSRSCTFGVFLERPTYWLSFFSQLSREDRREREGDHLLRKLHQSIKAVFLKWIRFKFSMSSVPLECHYR